jgi:hypothetical protein
MQIGRLPIDEQLVHFRAVVTSNQTLGEALTRAARLGLPGC